MRTLNLGIFAHVDAGKTSLTERLLHAAGVIDEPGSVDAGTSHTDVLAIERRRGITIQAAVVSFPVGDVTINLIDTPGHPDFIAEVERALAVLDGAVLVVSAVEGVQAQTRVLMRTLRRLDVPTLVFVNKIDRVGARDAAVLREIAERLTPSIVAMGTTRELGRPSADFVPFDDADLDPTVLADADDRVLAVLVGDAAADDGWSRRALAEQTARATVHPVFFGSAKTGAGIDALVGGITTLLPRARGDAAGPLAGTVFKVERGPAGERVAHVRLFTGTLRVRDRVGDHVVTGIEVFDRAATDRRPQAVAGEIAKVRGLPSARIGDAIGDGGPPRGRREFAPPTLDTVVVPAGGDRRAVHVALSQLAEQDPLIELRLDERRHELHVSLYGEVQKEVVQATLSEEFGLDVEFRDTTPICIERPVGTGQATEWMPPGRSAARPFLAGVGLRIDPAPAGSGVKFRYEIELGSLTPAFMTAIAETVPETLGQGLYGWDVTDCVVTLIHARYAPRQSHAHQGFSKAMSSTATDFRLLTPLVLADALRRAGTVVCEPVDRYALELPSDALPAVVPALARLGAPAVEEVSRPPALVLSGRIRAASVHALRAQLPLLTGGEGQLDATFAGYEPVRGAPPRRPRTDDDPFDRKEYLTRVHGRV
jgi:ribosomal protection tetracycline resistance protein